jgi:predicted aspartyl protease
MGLVYSEITLSNPILADLKPIAVKCLADTGSTYLVLPQHIATQLKLTPLRLAKLPRLMAVLIQFLMQVL